MELFIGYFVLAFVVTFILLYLQRPAPQIVIKYPNVKNKKSDLYVDDVGTCYRYNTVEVPCA